MKTMFHLVIRFLCLLLMLFLVQSKVSIGQKIIPTYDKVTHKMDVNSLSLSEDKTLALTTGEEGTYTIRDIATGKVVYYNSYDCKIYDGFFGKRNHIINLIAHSPEKSSIKTINTNTSQLIEENKIPNIPNVINSYNIHYVRSTISHDKDFVIFDNYKANEQTWSNDDKPKNFLIVYDINKKTSKEIILEENIDKLFPQFDASNNTILSYKKENKLTHQVYNTINGSLISESINNSLKKVSKIHLENKIESYNSELITITALSPNYEHIVRAGGEPLMAWGSGVGSLNVSSEGHIALWDVNESRQIWPTPNQKIQEELDLIIEDIEWIDNHHFIAVDIAGNIHYYNITKDTPEKQVFEPQKSSIALDISNDFNKIIFSSDKQWTGMYDLKKPDPITFLDSTINRFCWLADNGNYTYCEALNESDRKNFHIGQNQIERYSCLNDIENALLNTNGQVAAFSSSILTNYWVARDSIYNEDFIYDQSGKVIGYHYCNMMVYNERLNLRDKNKSAPHNPYSIDGIQVINLNSDRESFILESKDRGSQLQISENGRYISIGSSYKESLSLFNIQTKTWKYFNTGNPINTPATIKGSYFDKNSPIAVTVLDNNFLLIWNTETDEVMHAINDVAICQDLKIAMVTGNVKIDDKKNKLIFNQDVFIKSYDYTNNKSELIYDLPPTNGVKEMNISEFSDYIFIKYDTGSKSYGNFVSVSYDEIIDLKNKTSVYKELSTKVDLPFNGAYDIGLSKNCYFHNSKSLAFLYDGIGGLELYNLEERKTLANVKLFPNGDWLVYTPEGLFDANKNGRQSFYYTINNEVILYDQIKERFWETDLLNKVINGTVENPITNLGLPLYPNSEIDFIEESSNISVQLIGRSGGIGKVNLLINNTLRVEDINPDRKSSFTYDLKNIERYLYPKGINEISIRTYNRDGWMNSRDNSIFIETDLEALKAGQKGFSKTVQIYKDSIDLTPGLFGLFVGTSIYKDPKLNLKFSDDDAVALQDGFRKISEKMYDKERISLQILTSGNSINEKNSSKKNIIHALDEISKNAMPHDIIVIFLSGHGMTIDDDFYYLTSDAGTVDLHQDTKSRETVCLSSKEILEKLKQIRSNKQVIVLDACHSGQITQILSGSTKALSTTQEKALEFLEDKMGVYILASSESNQKSFETESLEKGLLTFGLLRGMSGGASKNGVINVIDLLNYASNEAEDIGKRVLNRTQRPVLNIAKGGSSFPIGFENSSLKVPLPKDKISIGESFIKKVLIDNIFHDPHKLNKELSTLLKERGAFGASNSFIYTQNENENTYTINGSYKVENDDIIIEWYILKNEEIFAGPFTKSKSIDKKTKLINIIISRSLETIKTMQ